MLTDEHMDHHMDRAAYRVPLVKENRRRRRKGKKMGSLEIFAWIVLIALIAACIAAWVVLAMLPGRIARNRNHPQADAINVSGWLGALALGIFWPLALIWAFYDPGARTKSTDEQDLTLLEKRVADLEKALAASAGRET